MPTVLRPIPTTISIPLVGTESPLSTSLAWGRPVEAACRRCYGKVHGTLAMGVFSPGASIHVHGARSDGRFQGRISQAIGTE